jgi:hypothetical protein
MNDFVWETDMRRQHRSVSCGRAVQRAWGTGRVPDRLHAGLVAGLSLIVCAPAWGGPNLVAIGNYGDVPFRRAEGRDSFSGKEIIYSFDDPEFDFGRVIVRSNQPKVLVRRDLFVGFTGDTLLLSTQPEGGRGAAGASAGGNIQIQELEVWLRINGKLRPGATYEWEVESVSAQESQGDVPALIPALWADGEQIAAEVNIKKPEQTDDDRIQRLLLPHGQVTLKKFEKQTGGAWIVLKPTGFGASIGLKRFSFREVDSDPAAATDAGMPVPVRYIPIRNVLEDEIAEALERSTRALKAQMRPDHTWGGDTDLAGRVMTTARVANALAELEPTLRDSGQVSEDVKQAMQWLAKQSPPAAQPWSLDTVAARLHCLARHGGLAEFGPAIQADVQFLVAAQASDGGWADRTPTTGAAPNTAGLAGSNHDDSARVLSALREARFAGAEPDQKVWKGVLSYWTEAQVYDGGFSNKLEKYGGVGQAPTSAYTATGAAALLAGIDMSACLGNKRCSAYMAPAAQLRGATRALEWLEKNYQEQTKDEGSVVGTADPYLEPARMQLLGGISGLSHFHEKVHFDEEARTLLENYDKASGLFGVRGAGRTFAQAPSLLRTADALSILGAGAAPTVCQRIIAGDASNHWGEYRGDAQHLVRYLASQRDRQFNWRRTSIDREVRELVEVPITILSVLGPFNWSQAEWQKVRDYCLAGGSVVIDIAEEAQGQRDAVLSALKQTFPEYPLAELPPDAPILTPLPSPLGKGGAEGGRLKVPGIQALGNGFRHFLFLPKQSWSCQWHLNQVDEHKEAFAFMNNLLTYATDDTPPRSSFAVSTYAVGSVPSKSVKAHRLQIGSSVPAYPNLVQTMDRLMRSNYRLAITEPSDPKEADLVWVNVAGPNPPSEPQRAEMLDALRGGKYLFVDVVSGNKDWDDGFRTALKQMDAGITLEKLSRGDPVFTGEIPGTQGFDAVKVNFRRALHTRFSTAGRCDLYAILAKGKPVGVYSAYDISSGIGYHYFPDCRGVTPQHARELAMNVFLAAYEWKVSAAASSGSGTKG